MAKCRECSISMGYAESQAASQYNGLCITCHVKQRVQTKIITAKDPGMSTTQRSTENVFNKFQDMLVTTESTINIRIKARCGVITTDFHYEFKRTPVTKRVWNFLRKKPEKKNLIFFNMQSKWPCSSLRLRQLGWTPMLSLASVWTI